MDENTSEEQPGPTQQEIEQRADYELMGAVIREALRRTVGDDDK
ncbi:hypothetical protein [Streptomyces triticirhizae]|nr:hypothetical protein [Streptomyces triticirhizae]